MKLARWKAPGREEPRSGVVSDDRVVVAFGDGSDVVDVLAVGRGAPPLGSESWALDEIELLAPVARPGTIYAIGLNYERHIAETGAQRPEYPIVFVKGAG